MSGVLEAMEARIAELERRLSALEHVRRPVSPVAAPIRAIAAIVAEMHGIEMADILGRDARRHIADARNEVYRRALEAGFSSTRIGMALGGRDHTTILSGAERARSALLADGGSA